MVQLQRTALAAALLLGTGFAASALAASPNSTGCPPGLHRADSEQGGGVGTVNMATRKAESEQGGGVGTVNMATRKAEAETGGAPQQVAQASPCR